MAMIVTHPARTGVRGGLPGLVLFVVAWLAMLTAATIVPSQPVADALVAQFGLGIICHAGDTQPASPTAPSDHPAHSCTLCPICVAYTQGNLLPPPPVPAPVAPTLRATAAFPWMPPAIGPPPFPVHRAQPRAPPSLI